MPLSNVGEEEGLSIVESHGHLLLLGFLTVLELTGVFYQCFVASDRYGKKLKDCKHNFFKLISLFIVIVGRCSRLSKMLELDHIILQDQQDMDMEIWVAVLLMRWMLGPEAVDALLTW